LREGEGKTAADLAEAQGHTYLTQYLREAENALVVAAAEARAAVAAAAAAEREEAAAAAAAAAAQRERDRAAAAVIAAGAAAAAEREREAAAEKAAEAAAVALVAAAVEREREQASRQSSPPFVDARASPSSPAATAAAAAPPPPPPPPPSSAFSKILSRLGGEGDPPSTENGARKEEEMEKQVEQQPGVFRVGDLEQRLAVIGREFVTDDADLVAGPLAVELGPRLLYLPPQRKGRIPRAEPQAASCNIFCTSPPFLPRSHQSAPMAFTYSNFVLFALLSMSCVLADEHCDKNKTSPVSGPVGNIWTVDPFIIPP
jgi:hypothetical protein